MTSNLLDDILIVTKRMREMKIIRRHYKGVTKQFGFVTWGVRGYRAFDFYAGKHLFVIGFERETSS